MTPDEAREVLVLESDRTKREAAISVIANENTKRMNSPEWKLECEAFYWIRHAKSEGGTKWRLWLRKKLEKLEEKRPRPDLRSELNRLLEMTKIVKNEESKIARNNETTN